MEKKFLCFFIVGGVFAEKYFRDLMDNLSPNNRYLLIETFHSAINFIKYSFQYRGRRPKTFPKFACEEHD